MRTRNRRVGVAAATTVTAVAIFGAVGGVGFAGGVASLHQYGPGPGQYQYAHKVTICHKGKHTIRVSESAWPAHQRHGDTSGPCAEARKHADKSKGKSGGEHSKNAEHGKAVEHGSTPGAAPSSKPSGSGNGKEQGGKHDD